ncbi:HAD family hydrolase [Demequina sp. NBRC 110057]|uniref:HAD family hydrolase n=1 Tax=Demequina sp. NBRC 110057 TaxID=1570346 RepID=UPI000A01FADC|nr:HAD family hydrolase [Demequina sp. NBRC 110057]
MRPTVIFDFDGTLALGDGPVRAYARCVADAAGDSRIVDDFEDALVRIAAGSTAFRDGYHAVAASAASHGVDAATMDAAYLASRALLGTDEAPIEAPAGLGDFLDALAEHADRLLVTNAPDINLDLAIASLGAAGKFEGRVTSARKPVGIEAVVTDALTRGPVLSIGDIHEYDLAPAAALGADTALVGPAAARPPATITMAAVHLPDLYPAIQSWAAQSARLG